jgi:hypothetical protein
MRKLGISPIIVLIVSISSCTPTPTPYVSNIDPCDPDILTAVASAGAISRCDKIPTVPPQVVPSSIEKERELEIAYFLNALITHPRYDPSQQVLAIYIDNIEIDIEEDALHFHINLYPTTAEDAISLSADLIFAGALVSNAGESGDWRLGIIDVNFPGNSETCGVSLFVNNENDLARISKNQVSVYDVMDSYVCELDDTNLSPSPKTNTLLCKDTFNLVGSTVECKIPRAYCSYQLTTSGEPTFCNDAPYPYHNFTLFIWGEDWSGYDGECIIIRGDVSMYQNKPQIEAFDRSQISSCP